MKNLAYFGRFLCVYENLVALPPKIVAEEKGNSQDLYNCDLEHLVV